jgi:hypothetical protein
MVVLTVMSFPEGPIEGAQAHDETQESVDSAPTDGVVAAVRRSLRTYVETWAERYVEMRVDARSGRRRL